MLHLLTLFKKKTILSESNSHQIQHFNILQITQRLSKLSDICITFEFLSIMFKHFNKLKKLLESLSKTNYEKKEIVTMQLRLQKKLCKIIFKPILSQIEIVNCVTMLESKRFQSWAMYAARAVGECCICPVLKFTVFPHKLQILFFVILQKVNFICQ